MAETRYSSFAQWSSNYQFVVYIPSNIGLPSPSYYWHIIQDSSSNYYLAHLASSNSVCSNISAVSVSNSSSWYDSDIDFSSGDSFYYELTSLDNISSPTRFSTNFRRPTVANNSDIVSLCSSVKSYGSFNANRLIINTYEYEDPSSGSGGSYDDTNLISAVLMIPATLICLACMAVIFKMFINRRVRG